MRKFLFFLAAAIAATTLTAAPVDQAVALKKAKSYLANNLNPGQVMGPDALNPVLIKAEIGNTKLGKPVYYIFNTSAAFVVISGDDRSEEVLMIGDGPLDLDHIPDGLTYMLGCYKEQIEFLQKNPDIEVDKPSEQNHYLRAVTYGPLLTAQWAQEAPYYNLCKFTYNNKEYQCVTGCPATSAAMVLHYWKHPTAQVAAIASYTRPLDISSTPDYTNYVNFTYPALPATTFDWNNMKNTYSYGSYNTTQANAVATLMRYVGQAEKMMYGATTSSGSGLYSNETQKVVDMFVLFGYDPSTCRVVYKSSYSDANWSNLLINELAAGRPMVYNGTSSSGGHAFNVDGYRDSDIKFHVNFGWGTGSGAWCLLNAFSYGGITFNQGQQAIIGIQPEDPSPRFNVEADSLNFSGFAGVTYSKTINITGKYLTGNLSLIVDSPEFTVTPSTLTPEEVNAGATVTVSYTASEAGTHTGTLTVSGGGAENQTVALSGTAVARPTLTANPSVLNFTTTVGQSTVKTFVLRGKDLSGPVLLSVSGEGFSIDKNTVLKATALKGVTVTVTYSPTEVGNHTGTVTLNSTDAEPVIVQLNGTANDDSPIITANPTSLSFSAVTGESTNKSFIVNGANLTGDLTLTLNDESGAYSISRTSVSASQAASGMSIRVTYAPTTYGNHDATVTISGGGASDVTVNLSGVASLTKFGPVMLEPNDVFVALNRFRAEWTDETPEMNVASYTLEVNGVAPTEPEPELLASLDGTAYTGSYTAVNLTAPWGGTNVYAGNSAFYFRNNYQGSTSPGNITYTIPAGYTNATFTMKIKTTSNNYGAGNFAVGTPQTDAVNYYLSAGASQYWVVTASSGEKITITTTDDNYCADIAQIEVYSGNASPAKLTATETGGFNYRLIEGITPNKYYTVKDLTDGGTFIYRVKALYIDGTESDWSNEQEVTLHENEHPYTVGDANHDEAVDVNDVTMVIAYILGVDNGICPICANVNSDDAIDVSDVTTIISMILGAGSSN